MEFTVTWASPQNSGGDDNTKYRVEWWKKLVTGYSEVCQEKDIGGTHFKITGLEYSSEYEVKLFAVNGHGDSEPDVRTFKTKTGMYLYI